jgi:hypothetical protein
MALLMPCIEGKKRKRKKGNKINDFIKWLYSNEEIKQKKEKQNGVY